MDSVYSQQTSPIMSFISQYKAYIAGSINGISQIIVGKPFDTLKVRSIKDNIGLVQVLQKIRMEDGLFKGLYKGISSPLIGQSGIVSIQFGVCEAAKRFMMEIFGYNTPQELPIQHIAACGAAGGFAGAILTTPVEHIRIRLELSQGSQFTSAGQCLRSIYSNYGISGVFKGLFSTIARETPGMALYFFWYELAMRKLKVVFEGNEKMLAAAPLLAGSMAGLGFWVPMYPFDNVKTKIQGDRLKNPKYKGIINCFVKSVKKGGVADLYKGVVPCAMRSVPSNAVGFLAFEQVKQAIEKFTENQYY